MMIAVPVPEPSQPLAVVLERVTPVLMASQRLRAVSVERQERLIQDLVHAADAAARAIAARQHEDLGQAGATSDPPREGTSAAAALARSVDFPTFVTDLIRGTFESIVNASIRQMEAFGELLRNIAKPVDEFMRDNEVGGDGADDRDHLAADDDSSRRRLAADRQQQLATMVLMGINRLVVTKGTITARVAVDLTPRRRPPP
jgi:hypothetical protein